MPTFTAQTLIDRAAAAADMHDNFVSTTTWLNWLTQERYALETFLARSGWPLNFQTLTITVDGTEGGDFELWNGDVDEPQYYDVLALVAVHRVVSAAGVQRLDYDDAVTFLKQLPSAPVNTGEPRKYRLSRKTNLVTFENPASDTVNTGRLVLNFYPDPPVGTQLLVTFIPAPARIDSLVDNCIYPLGWEERIVLGMARRALDKEESDSSAIQRQIKELDAQIEAICWNRVMSESPRVRNSDRSVTDLPTREAWAWV